MGPIQHFDFDLRFDSQDDLKRSYESLYHYIQKEKKSDSQLVLNMRHHWSQKTLNPENHKVVIDWNGRIAQEFKNIHLINFLPTCLSDPIGISTYPDCSQCIFQETHRCRYPGQMRTKYYTVPQKSWPQKLEDIALSDFEGPNPLTWFTPKRSQIHLIKTLSEKCEVLLDFGSGTGFIDYLIFQEGYSNKIHAVDPYVENLTKNSKLKVSANIPSGITSHSVLSSLADFHVPIEKAIETRPEIIFFIAFPQVFGRGGFAKKGDVFNGVLDVVSKERIFHFEDLDNAGYTEIHEEMTPSYFFEDTCFKIYVKKENEIIWRETLEEKLRVDLRYPWENSCSLRNETTSDFSLS